MTFKNIMVFKKTCEKWEIVEIKKLNKALNLKKIELKNETYKIRGIGKNSKN